MTKSKFTEADVRRAVKGVLEVGGRVSSVEIWPDGRISVTVKEDKKRSMDPKRGTFAFDPKIAPFAEEVIAEAAQGNPTASYAVGAYILWQLDDPDNARPYLEIAGEAGVPDALIDLAVLELLSA